MFPEEKSQLLPGSRSIVMFLSEGAGEAVVSMSAVILSGLGLRGMLFPCSGTWKLC